MPWGLLLITINSHGQTLSLGNTTFWWIIQSIVLLLFFVAKLRYTAASHNQDLYFLNLYLIYVIISFFRGVFIAEGYWDWKNLLNNTMCLLIPMLAYAANSISLFKHILSSYIYYTAPLFLIVQFFIGKDEFGFYLAPFSFLLLFVSIIPFKWKILFVLIAIYVIFADFGARSNLIKFIVPILFSLIYFIKNYCNNKILNLSRLLLMLAPFIFFILAITDTFNLFNPSGDKQVVIIDKKKDFNGNIVEDNLVADTRTFLYVEVLSTAKVYDSWLVGRSPARGNISEYFGDTDMNKRGERNANEVSILNYFTWLGSIGVLFMFIIFYQASYLAINYSNNIFSKIMGLFIAFRWAYAWVEDINNFYIQYLFLWLFIGFCYSKRFRQMSNIQMKKWVKSIFDIPSDFTSFPKSSRKLN